jgi:hypothetical protein
MMAEIIMKLRRSRATSPIFGDRVVGVAEASRAFDYQSLACPAAFVCFLSDHAERQDPGANENQQRVTQMWGVIVALEATMDIRGQDPTQQIDEIRREIFRAIYNWSPDKHYGNFWYNDTKLLAINRAITFWLLSFGSYYYVCGAIGEGETEDQFEPLPPFEAIDGIAPPWGVDWIKPHDPGLPPSQIYDPKRGPAPWPSGPEGRIEQRIRFNVEPQPPPPIGVPRDDDTTKH